jgi:superfamily II DNA or RNA helicase
VDGDRCKKEIKKPRYERHDSQSNFTAYKVEKAHAEGNDLKCQLEIYRDKVHTLHQEKENETLDRQEERAKLAGEVERAETERRNLKYQLEIYREKVYTLYTKRRKKR